MMNPLLAQILSRLPARGRPMPTPMRSGTFAMPTMPMMARPPMPMAQPQMAPMPQTAPMPQAAPAMPQATPGMPTPLTPTMPAGLATPQNATVSIFDLVGAPQPAQFDVTAASGTKPKNYQPTQVEMTGVPTPSVFALNPGALPQNAFDVTAASGTKPKNYQPTQVTMNAPQLAGPQAMQQMLALMRGTATPFSPYGQG